MNANYQLFLDDQRTPRGVTWIELPLGPWVVARSYADFVRCIQTRGVPELVSFDHDLKPEHYAAASRSESCRPGSGTGADCARWLVEHCTRSAMPLPKFIVHSLSPIGRHAIVDVMIGAGAVEIARTLDGSLLAE